MFRTNHLQEGWFNIETNLSLLIFPLIFYTRPPDSKESEAMLKAYIGGTLFCSMLCIFHAAIRSFTENENLFYYQDLSWFQHPSYLSMYLSFASFLLIFFPILRPKMTLALIAFFSIIVALLSSKMGVLFHYGGLSLWMFGYLAHKKKYIQLFAAATSALMIFLLMLMFVQPIKERFKNLFYALKAAPTKSATESSAVRILIWKEAIHLIKEKPILGHCPGDVNQALLEKYKSEGLTGAYQKKLNAHNQYLQTTIGLGITGLALLLLIFVLPLLYPISKINLAFLILAGSNFFAESMLQNMAGCIFFGYFYALLIIGKK